MFFSHSSTRRRMRRRIWAMLPLYLWDAWHRRRGEEPIDEAALREALQDEDEAPAPA